MLDKVAGLIAVQSDPERYIQQLAFQDEMDKISYPHSSRNVFLAAAVRAKKSRSGKYWKSYKFSDKSSAGKLKTTRPRSLL